MLITCRPAYTYISYQGHGVSSPHGTSNITHNVDDTDNESRPSQWPWPMEKVMVYQAVLEQAMNLLMGETIISMNQGQALERARFVEPYGNYQCNS